MEAVLKPFRKNLAIAIDGGGIHGVIVTQALSMLEQALGRPLHGLCRLAAGTSTGAIIAAGLGTGMTAHEMHELYLTLGPQVFPGSLRKLLFPLTSYRYDPAPLASFLKVTFGEKKMGDFWIANPPTDIVITSFDLVENRDRFIKPWKKEYAAWPVDLVVQSSCTVPTYFPPVEGRYIDGGVGAYANPAYLAAYEAVNILHWDPLETTLLSLGTGREPYSYDAHKSRHIYSWQWIFKMFGAFLASADDQQVHLVETLFGQLDFRRFQVDMAENIDFDNVYHMDTLVAYGRQMGEMILADQVDRAMQVVPKSSEF